MGIFDLFGGREPRTEFCHTVGCGNPREHGLTFCKACQMRRVETWMQGGTSELEAWIARPLTEQLPAVRPPARLDRIERELPSTLDADEVAREQELMRTFSAPLFENMPDRRCYWCCKMLNEGAYDTSELVKPTRAYFECPRHGERHMANIVVDGKMQEMRYRRGMTTSQIAHYFRYGYLGEYLSAGYLSDYDGDHSDKDNGSKAS